MRHKDRNRVQVPANLPDWMDSFVIRRMARKWGVSYETAKMRMMRRGYLTRWKKK